MANKKIWISPITKTCFVGTLNKKWTMWLKKEELDDDNVDDFIVNYIMLNKPKSWEFNWKWKPAKITIVIESDE